MSSEEAGPLGAGRLFVVSAPSGAGKSTLVQKVLERYGAPGQLEFSVSYTTRALRGQEQDGRSYHFVTDDRFQQMVDDGEFLEWAVVHGNRYGTSRDDVERRLHRGSDVLLEIDVQGARQIIATVGTACSIFILPPSYEVLAGRLTDRAEDSGAEIRRRLAVSLSEIECYRDYDCVIVNDDLERASRQLAAVVLASGVRREAMEGRVQEILEDFRASLAV